MSGSSSAAGQYIPVEIQTFRGATRDIHFDVYLKLADDNYAHVFSRATGLDYRRLANYVQKGVKELFVKVDDLVAYKEFTSNTAESIFRNPMTSPEKKIASLLNMTEQNIAELFTKFPVSEETAESTEKVVKSYVKLMGEDPNALAILLKLVAHGEYLYYHSIAVSILSLFVAKGTGRFDEKGLEIVGMGGFMHDIGVPHVPVPEGVTRAFGDVPDENAEGMEEHAKLGLQMIERTRNIPDEVRYIVCQHHEQPSGNGYPNRLHSNAIFFPAKIVGAVDAFANLIAKRPGSEMLTPFEAIKMMNSAKEKYDPEIVKILALIFIKGEAPKSVA